MIVQAGRIDARIVIKAANILDKFTNEEIKCRKLNHLEMWCLEVGYRYRLLSYDKKSWKLMSHSDYSKLISPSRR